jgi:methionyl-tRNA formyltransferase
MHKVVIFCPNPKSLYTLCVAHLLQKENVKVEAIIIRRMFTPQRILSELRRDGLRLLIKVWNKLILKRSAYSSAGTKTLKDVKEKEYKILESDIKTFAKRNSIKVIECKEFNTPHVETTITQGNIDAVIFTGGGIIRESIIKAPKKGIINCHMGLLPQYRGMDVVEWPLLLDQFQSIGLTTHLMDTGLDTGDILNTHPITIEKTDTDISLRAKMERNMPEYIVTTTISYLNGEIKPQKQKFEDGKQYFIMHPKLKEIAKNKLVTYTHSL